MEIREATIDELKPDSRNANLGTQPGQELLEKSVSKFKAGRSILLDKNGRIIAGNKTAATWAKVGLNDVLIVPTDGTKLIAVQRTDVDLDSPEGREMAIADNRVGQINLDWDAEVLAETHKAIGLGDWFDPSEIASWDEPADNPSDEEDEENTGDLLKNAGEGNLQVRCKTGQIWGLGKHRLVVGDVTEEGVVAGLMAGRKASMVWTDPPYNVDYDPEQRASGFSKERLENPLGKILNDKMSPAQFRSFLDAVYSQINEALVAGGAIYISHADTEGHHFRSAFVAQPWNMQSCLIWKKSVLVFGRADYHWMHEPILYGWKEGASHKYYGDRKQTTILEFAAPHFDRANLDTDGYVHPTQKPVPLIEYCILNSSKPGEIVLDLFGGSGSTLIACQKGNRIGYLAEKDVRFATVILERFEQFTGTPAELIGAI